MAKVTIIGAGPAGLFCGYLIKKARPTDHVTIYERDSEGTTFGFGVVFQDKALSFLESADKTFADRLTRRLERWDDLAIYQNGKRVLIDGNAYTSIARLDLLSVLAGLCRASGVELCYGTAADPAAMRRNVDLLIGADGINSTVRSQFEQAFNPEVRWLNNRFAWFGTRKSFGTLSLTFRSFEGGSFVAHHYRYANNASTFIVECDSDTFARAGLERMDEVQSAGFCARIFDSELDGHPLLINRSRWRRFPVVSNRNWYADNMVLIGDALRSVHFSIGSGTRMALDDAHALAACYVAAGGNVGEALGNFYAQRQPVVNKIVTAAGRSLAWYENFSERMHLDAFDLAYDYMMRSGRLDETGLREVAPRFMRGFDSYRAGKLIGE